MNDQLKQEINRLKSEIDALRPLDKDTEGRIQQKFRLDWNYHSNNIEGNSLTFGETKSFLLHGITAAGKPLKDHLDIKGHNEALHLLEDVIKDSRPLNETFIRELHQIILHEPFDKPAVTPDGQKTTRRINVGQYKTQPNHVITKTGETFYFAKPEETAALMNDLIVWYNTTIDSKKIHPVELAALFHYRFIRIHPFDDGNGRISRILMNLTLMKFGFPPVIIKTQKKEEYYRALQQADGGDTDLFVDYISQLEVDSLELYLRGAKGEHIEEEDDVVKEILLFKRELNGHRFSHKRSDANQKELLDNSIIPCLTRFVIDASNINDLFRKTVCVIDTDFSGLAQSDKTFRFNIEYLTTTLSTYFNNNNYTYLSVQVKWQEFYRNKLNQFDTSAGIHFRFGDYDYIVATGELKIQKGYDEQLNDSELATIIKQSLKPTISAIKSSTEDIL